MAIFVIIIRFWYVFNISDLEMAIIVFCSKLLKSEKLVILPETNISAPKSRISIFAL